MLRGQGLLWLSGSVIVHIRSGVPEELVNQALSGGIALSAIRWTSKKQLQFEVSISDFFRLRPYLRQTGCRLHVAERKGLPFWLVRAEKRIWFASGLAVFFALIFLLSSLVWSVKVEGNVRLSDEEVLAIAKQEGVYPMQWAFRLPDADIISKQMVNDLPGTSWIGVEKKGTKIVIQVVEMTLPDESELQNPRNLVASEDAVITRIIAETGNAVVKKNMRVKKGQTLITGVIGSETHSQIVVADGTVRGLVWYKYKIEAPLIQKHKVYTGEQSTEWHLVIGSRALQISGFGKTNYEWSEVITEEEKVSWRNWTLPFGRMKETIRESQISERTLTESEAKQIALLQAKAKVIEKAGTDAVIQDEIILHEELENGKVYMEVLFEVEQSIVKEMPIVQMQGE